MNEGHPDDQARPGPFANQHAPDALEGSANTLDEHARVQVGVRIVRQCAGHETTNRLDLPSGTATGPAGFPTICATPELLRTATRSASANRAKQYPGNSGKATSLRRSFQFAATAPPGEETARYRALEAAPRPASHAGNGCAAHTMPPRRGPSSFRRSHHPLRRRPGSRQLRQTGTCVTRSHGGVNSTHRDGSAGVRAHGSRNEPYYHTFVVDIPS